MSCADLTWFLLRGFILRAFVMAPRYKGGPSNIPKNRLTKSAVVFQKSQSLQGLYVHSKSKVESVWLSIRCMRKDISILPGYGFPPPLVNSTSNIPYPQTSDFDENFRFTIPSSAVHFIGMQVPGKSMKLSIV